MSDAEAAHSRRVDELRATEDTLRRAGVWTYSHSSGSAGVTLSLTHQADLITDEAAVAGKALSATARLYDGGKRAKEDAGRVTAEASGVHFAIDDSGVVRDLIRVPSDEQAARDELKRGFEQDVSTVMRIVGALLSQVAADLEEAASGRVSDGGAQSVDQAVEAQSKVKVPGRGTDPYAVAAWWHGLSPAQQHEAITAHPDRLGKLDGVPVAARDEANRLQLPREMERIQAAIDSAQSRFDSLKPPVYGPGNEFDNYSEMKDLRQELEGLQNKKADLEAIQKRIGPAPNGGQNDRYLMHLDADAGPVVEAAVAVGDVDNATNVSLTVPGLNTNPRDSLDGMVREANGLKKTAENLDRGNNHIAAIAFIGYQPPQDLAHAASNSMAHDGAPKVANALEGLQASSAIGDKHIVAFGHSYGSNVLGQAMQQIAASGNLSSVDDVVFYGSPGIEDRGDRGFLGSFRDPGVEPLGVVDGHAYYMSNPKDFVSSWWSPIPDHLGPVPSEWGADKLSTDPAVTELGPTTGVPDGVSSHSAYAKDGTTSQFNLAAILADREEKLVR